MEETKTEKNESKNVLIRLSVWNNKMSNGGNLFSDERNTKSTWRVYTLL